MASGPRVASGLIVIAVLCDSCLAAPSLFAPHWRANYTDPDDLTSGIPGLNASRDCASVDGNVSRSGNYSVQHKLHKSDPDRAGSKRCESDSMAMKGTRIKRGQTQYYGLSLFLPTTWSFDNKPLADILFQWKGFRGGPFITLQQKHNGLYLRAPGRQQFEITRTVQLGKWHDIRLKIHWEVNQSGVIEMDYKTADLAEYARVISYEGATMDRDAGGYLKWGIYKPVWKTNPEASAVSDRSVWHDNIAVGFSWAEVDPSQHAVRRLGAQKISPNTESDSTAPVQRDAGILLL